ncbi:heme-dependent oxidative N-demethylase family protein [Devosia riboflavina]
MTLPAFDTRLFQIATKPLDPSDWLDPDADMAAQLAEKARLHKTHLAEIFAELPESRPAQAELLSLLFDYLPSRFPHLWQRRGERLLVVPTGEMVEPGGIPLLQAAKLVQDDLLILSRTETGWRLVAASLSFPSSWVLADKIGKVLDAIHDPVPGFGPETRAAQLMARMFDALRPEVPMIRWNWSLYGDSRLFHPDVSGPDKPRFGTGDRADPVHLRIERQTLRKLPETGAIVFTIRISLVDLDTFAGLPDAKTLAGQLHTQLLALPAEQLDYKGLTRERERVLARLADII